MIALQQALADLGTLGLDDEARALFPTGNAERLFKLAGAEQIACKSRPVSPPPAFYGELAPH